jgi:copper transport protein
VLAGASAVVAAVLLAAAPAALAHATLVSTQPGDGTVVVRQPAQVSATFNQPVGTIAGSLRVYDPGGKRVDSGAVTHPRPQTIGVGVRGGLAHGTYTVAWRVISADSHEVEGAFTFSIGAPSAHVGITQQVGSPPVIIGYGAVRALAYGFYADLAGVVAFLIFCWPQGARRKGVTRLIAAGWAGLLGTSVLTLMFQGAYAEDKGIGGLLNANLVRATLHSRIGTALQAREVLGTVAAVAVTVIIPRLPAAGARARAAAGAAWTVLALALAATWAGYDHSSTGSQVPLALLSDIIHLTAAAIWVGGLLVLAAFVLRKPAAPAAATAVLRFSPIALGCVAAIAATGVYQAWREVGTLAALTGTTYGWLIVVKTVGLGCLIGLGYLARRYLGTGTLRRGQALSLRPARVLAVPGHPAQAATGRPAGTARLAGAAAPAAAATATAGSGVSAPAATATAGSGTGAPAATATAGSGVSAPAAAAGPATAARPSPPDTAGTNGSAGTNGTAGPISTAGPDSTTSSSGAAGPSSTAGPNGAAGPNGTAGPNGAAGPNGTAGNGAAAPGPPAIPLGKLRRSVLVEVVLVAVILAVSAVLVSTATGREAFSQPTSATVQFSTTGGQAGRHQLHALVAPARLGSNAIDLVLSTPDGRPYTAAQVEASLYFPARKIGPLPVRLARTGPGRYHATQAAAFTAAGHWQLLVTVRADAFDETTVTIPVTIY